MTLLVRFCLALFPAAFRREFGASMRVMLHDEIVRARQRGRLAAAWCAATGLVDLVTSAAAEWRRPTWTPGRSTQPDGKERLMHAVEQWGRDLRLAVRSLRRAPGFAVIATTTLALALAVGAAIFAVIDTVILQPPPFAHRDRLMYVVASAPGSEIPDEFGLFDEFFVLARERAALVEEFAFFTSFTGTVRVGERVERLRMAEPTFNMFATLGVAPLLGTLPNATPSASDPVRTGRLAVVSYTFWRDWLGSDPQVIGKHYLLDGDEREVVAVMRPDFVLINDAVVAWIPRDVRLDAGALGAPGVAAVARLAPGVTPDAAARELTALAHELPDRFGRSPAYDRLLPRLRVLVRPLMAEVLAPVWQPLLVLFAASLVVLAIACANVAHLVAVRAEGRRHELAVRQAIGAGRGQLVRSQLSEMIVLTAVATGIAIVLARAALPTFLSLAPVNVPRLAAATVGLRPVMFTGLLAAIAAIACGLWPALRASRVGPLDMRSTTRSVTGGRRWARDLLLVAQTALALVLLVGAGLLMRSYARLSHVNPGYQTDDRFTFQIAPNQPRLTDGPSYAQFSLDLMDRLATLPGVESVGLIENMPLDEGTNAGRFFVEGGSPDAAVRLSYTFAGPGYYETMGTAVLAGRTFSRDDAIGMRGNVVITRTAARLLWPDGNAIGRRLRYDRFQTWDTVIGVVDDVMQENWRQPPRATVYFPMTGHTADQWRLPSPAYVVKTRRADVIGPEIRALVRQVAPEAPMYRAYTMQFLAERQMRDLSFTMFALALVSSLAMGLGALGLYGSLAYAVTERTREIGVRLALGARPSEVRRMVVQQGAQIVGAGIAIGLIVAVVVAPVLARLLFGVATMDAATFVTVAGSMALVGLVASYFPARRASLVDPIVALRGE